MNYTMTNAEDFSVITKDGGEFVIPSIPARLVDSAYPISYEYDSTPYTIEKTDYVPSMLSGNAMYGWTLTHEGHTICKFYPKTGVSNPSLPIHISNLNFNGSLTTTLEFVQTGATLEDIQKVSSKVEQIDNRLTSLLEDETLSNFYDTASSNLNDVVLSSAISALYVLIHKCINAAT